MIYVPLAKLRDLPKPLRKWAIIATALWSLVPLRALAQAVVPGADEMGLRFLEGKSANQLLIVAVIAASGCTLYVVKAFIAYVMQSKKDDKEQAAEHAQALKDQHKENADALTTLHETTRAEFRDSIKAMMELTAELRERK